MKESIKSLGVYIGPALDWEKQFNVMKEKIRESVTKIESMEIHPATAYIFFNMYLSKKVFFGCGIFVLIDKQE